MREVAAAEVGLMMREKQALEVRLAWDLLEIFNNPALGFIGRLREMVVRSIQEMDAIASAPQTGAAFRQLWSGDWRKYAVCTENGIVEWRPAVIAAQSQRFIAQHCADWIRIFGEVIEKVAKGHANDIRKSYQQGGDDYWTKFEPGKGEQPHALRARLNETDTYFHHRGQQLGAKAGPIAPPPPGLYAGDQSVWSFQRGVTPTAGIGRWRIMERDVTGKMDQVFGLMPGATLSGTTTDTIFFLERFGAVGVDPTFYLLPVATIVAGGHHSLLEVALPLSLNGIGDYKVGLYTTLLPAGSYAAAAAIKSALRAAEEHLSNRLMLVHYEGMQPAGCVLYDQASDRQRWRGMVRAQALLDAFKVCRPWPNRADVEALRRVLQLER